MIARDILLKALEIIETKSEDYDSGERCKNFFEAAKIASILRNKNIDAMDVAACLIGVKFSRYGNLTSKAGEPNFESIEDTAIDSINYVGLLEEIRQLIVRRNQSEDNPG